MGPLNDYDFVSRTREILAQYKTLNLPEDKNYDVTLFINACVGLLFVAKETGSLPTGTIQQYGLVFAQIPKNNMGASESELEAICRHIRNSIAHKRFKTSGKPIDTLYFEDRNETDRTFYMEVSLTEFKTFVMNISKYFLDGKI